MGTSWLIILSGMIIFILYILFITINKITRNNVFVFKTRDNKIKKGIRLIYLIAITISLILIIRYFDNYFMSIPITIALLFLFSLLQIYFIDSKMIIINSNGIRNPLHWKYKWGDIENYNIDKGKNYLSIYLSNNTQKHFHGIDDCDIDTLQNVLAEIFKNKL